MRWRTGAENGSGPGDLYRFGPGLVICIRGDRRAKAHFRAEYAAAALVPGSAAPALEATIGARVRRARAARGCRDPQLHGAHKLARWHASVSAGHDGDPLRVAVEVRGPLGLMLAQSYVLEPLVSLAAARAKAVLLPSAAIALRGRALLLIGRSRSGKSSLAARALAAGLRILGDDQVVINAKQDCLPFPRRLRLYPDLAQTAPAAFASLRPAARGSLAALGRVSAVTHGFVAPPLRISASSLGAAPTPSRLPIGEVVVIRRAPVDVLTTERLDQGELAAEADDSLREQRSILFSAPALQAGFATLLAQERATMSSAFADIPARRVLVPTSWPAEQAVGTLAHELRLER